ncbi:MAG: antibiotic biosynthesis monooxygenase [Candidatus Lambdaproteobacteria bacterium]|nr:antibiotic biosynthesis monooxygenase [Candidatus Lambdaproteobacteria bacterium]
MIVLGATIKAKAGSEAKLADCFKRLAEKVKTEEGTLVYIFNQSKKTPTTFLVYEQYKDQAAFDHHGQTPYFKEIGREMGQHMDGRPTLEFYDMVAGFKK